MLECLYADLNSRPVNLIGESVRTDAPAGAGPVRPTAPSCLISSLTLSTRSNFTRHDYRVNGGETSASEGTEIFLICRVVCGVVAYDGISQSRSGTPLLKT
jgi:hypothetical protein